MAAGHRACAQAVQTERDELEQIYDNKRRSSSGSEAITDLAVPDTGGSLSSKWIGIEDARSIGVMALVNRTI